MILLPEKLMEVLKHESIAAIVTEGTDGAHVVNAYNSCIKITADGRFLIPVGVMNVTEANIKQNSKVLMTLGSREVQGCNSMGTGFLIRGIGAFVYEGPDFDEMKDRFPWIRAVLKIEAQSITQTL